MGASFGSVTPLHKEAKAGPNTDGDIPNELRTQKLALIGVSPLLQECLSRALSGRLNSIFVSFSSVDDWLQQANAMDYALILFYASGSHPCQDIATAARAIEQAFGHPQFAVVADSDRPAEVRAAFEFGARAYIPTSVSVGVLIEAIKLVLAGGTYCPASVLQSYAATTNAKQAPAGRVSELTPREAAVLKAVRLGQPNKVIAYDLGISESTIKVHVHRIMKKLKVQNRTQIAICTSIASNE